MSAVISSSWMPMPTETSAGGCSSQPRAKLGMMKDTWGSLPSLKSFR